MEAIASTGSVARAIEVALDVRPNERRTLSLLLVHAFFKGVSAGLFDTAANTYFVSSYRSSTLPWVYVTTAIASGALGLLYARAERKVTPVTLFRALLVTLAIAIGIFYVLASIAPQKVGFPIMVWKDAHNIFINVEFWAVAGLLFDVRQGKRLFALLGVGDVIGGIVAGLSVPLFVDRFGTASLLLIAFFAVVLSAFTLQTIVHARGDRFVTEEQPLESEARSIPAMVRDPYLALFFGVSVVCYLNFYLVDYVFFAQTREHVQSPESLARFFGILFAVCGAGNLLATSLISGRVIRRFGVGAGLLALPVAMVIGSVGMGVVSRVPDGMQLFFSIIVATKALEEILRVSFQVPSYRLLYQPLRPSERLRAQAIRESMVEPLAVGLSGLALLALTRALGLHSTTIAWFVGGTAALWILLSARLKRAYASALQVALSRRHLDGGVVLFDAESAKVLERGLASVHPGEVVLSLRMMEQREVPRFFSAIVEAAGHEDPIVAGYALERIRELELVAALDRVRARMDDGPPEVRGAAVRAYCALMHEEAIEGVTSYLRAPEPVVRKSAVIGLLRSGGIKGGIVAETVLEELVASPRTDDRRAAADIIGSADIASLSRPLRVLLGDRDRGVRSAALAAAARLRSLDLVEPLLAVIERPDMRDGACRALVGIGEPAIPALEAACRERPSLRDRIGTIYARIGTPRALQALANGLGEGNASTDGAILENLVRGQFRPSVEDHDRLRKRIFAETEAAARSLAAVADLGPGADVALLGRALAIEVRERVSTALSLLALLYPGRAMIDVKRKYGHGTSENRAAAIETLDNMLPRDLRAAVLPLLEDGGSRSPQKRLSRDDRIAEIATRPLAQTHAWTKTCALALVTERPGLDRALVEAVKGPDRMVREAAGAAAARLGMDVVLRAIELSAVPEMDLTNTRGLALNSPLSPGKRSSMLLTIEKVMILKSVALFADLPESMLADVASALAEAEVHAGDRIVDEGAVGTAMYIIVSGAVSLTTGGKDLAMLGPRQVFGELAALDPRPRTATATATADTHLFRIEADVLYELMSDSTDFTRALVAGLCRRLRDAQQQQR
ncbi:MAG: Npt1/Npt2 family nucleotide transporter [Polyangiales bacterium]